MGTGIVKKYLAVAGPGQKALSFSMGLLVVAIYLLGYQEICQTVDLERVRKIDLIFFCGKEIEANKIIPINVTIPCFMCRGFRLYKSSKDEYTLAG